MERSATWRSVVGVVSLSVCGEAVAWRRSSKQGCVCVCLPIVTSTPSELVKVILLVAVEAIINLGEEEECSGGVEKCRSVMYVFWWKQSVDAP